MCDHVSLVDKTKSHSITLQFFGQDFGIQTLPPAPAPRLPLPLRPLTSNLASCKVTSTDLKTLLLDREVKHVGELGCLQQCTQGAI